MSTFAERLKKVLYAKDMSASELARLTGLNRATISQYLSGKYEPKQGSLDSLSKALNVSHAYLLGTSEKRSEVNYITFPVIGKIKCGYGEIAEYEDTGDIEQIPTDWIRGDSRDNFCVLQAKGDSLYPLVCENDRVLIHKTVSVPSGTLAAVLVGEEVTLKRVFYKQNEDWIRLESVNPAYPPKIIKGSELETVRIFGEVKRLIRVF